jgi:RimJ/RimL family protein N-acetyltransferase
MLGMKVRHFTTEDIPLRTELLRESRFQANLTDFATLTEDDALTANQASTIAGQHDVKRIFTVVGKKEQVIAFVWITSIDWIAQSCELSFALLPRYRGGFGPAMSSTALEYLHEELNMEVVINQVLSHNTMLQSADKLAAMSKVVSEFDCYTVGEWRTARYWTQSRDEFRAGAGDARTGRAELSARIRAAVAGGAS